MYFNFFKYDLIFKPICGLFTPLLINCVILKLVAEFRPPHKVECQEALKLKPPAYLLLSVKFVIEQIQPDNNESRWENSAAQCC